MKKPFINRSEAGKLLAENLNVYADRDDVLDRRSPRNQFVAGGIASQPNKAVPQQFEGFSQTADEEVEKLPSKANHRSQRRLERFR